MVFALKAWKLRRRKMGLSENSALSNSGYSSFIIVFRFKMAMINLVIPDISKT